MRKLLILGLPVIFLLNMISIPVHAAQPSSAKAFIISESDDPSPVPEPSPEPTPEPTPAPEPEPEPEPTPAPTS